MENVWIVEKQMQKKKHPPSSKGLSDKIGTSKISVCRILHEETHEKRYKLSLLHELDEDDKKKRVK